MVLKPESNDFCTQIEKDKMELKICLTDAEVRTFSKVKYRNFIKFKIETHIRQVFEDKKRVHKKQKYLIHFQPKPQQYLLSRNLSIMQIQRLIQLRTHTLAEAKVNFKGIYGENIWCEVCHLFPSSQEHIFTCFQIRKEVKPISD